MANRKYLCKTIWRGTENFPFCGCLRVRDIPSQRHFSEFLIHVTYSDSKHRHCTATTKSANRLSSSPPFPVSCWILTCGSSSPRRLYMAFSPVNPSMILASSSSPTAWCLSHCLSLPLAYNRKEILVMRVCVRPTAHNIHINFFGMMWQFSRKSNPNTCSNPTQLSWSSLKEKSTLTRKEHVPSVTWSFFSSFVYGILTVNCRNVNLSSCKYAENVCGKSVQKYIQLKGYT